MESLQGIEVVRATPAAIRARRVDDQPGPPIIDVRFSAFGNWYEIDSFFEGRFLERTARGAFARAINAWAGAKEGKPARAIQVLFNHGADPQIGDKPLGTIEDLREDDDAAVGVVRLFDTSYNRDLIPGLEAGVYGSSMRMVVTKDEWNDAPARSEHNPDGIPERTIKEVRLLEFGPVTFPANPEATAAMRSATDAYYSRLPERDRPQIRTPEVDGPAPALRAEGPAQQEPTDQAASHSDGPTPAQRREVLLNMTLGGSR